MLMKGSLVFDKVNILCEYQEYSIGAQVKITLKQLEISSNACSRFSTRKLFLITNFESVKVCNVIAPCFYNSFAQAYSV